MSDGPGGSFRGETLGRFVHHRRAWRENEALRALYERWYGRVRAALPPRPLGPWVELGSGPGLARELIADLRLTDVVPAPWHDFAVAAEALPFSGGSLGALVLFDVLHHLPAPGRFWSEAVRVLRPGGRLVLCEPYVSALSYPVYRFFHEEGLDMSADPFADTAGVADGVGVGIGAGVGVGIGSDGIGVGVGVGKDPFAGNQAIPSLVFGGLFGSDGGEIERRFPALRVVRVEHLAGLSYPASGGFSRRPLLPLGLWRALLALEDRLPSALFRLFGFRLFAIVERR